MTGYAPRQFGVGISTEQTEIVFSLPWHRLGILSGTVHSLRRQLEGIARARLSWPTGPCRAAYWPSDNVRARSRSSRVLTPIPVWGRFVGTASTRSPRLTRISMASVR